MSINLRPIRDCIILSDDEEFNNLTVYVYTDAPRKPYDAFNLYLYGYGSLRKKEGESYYLLEEESPIILRMEMWKWDEELNTYKKIKEEEILIDDKAEEKALKTKYLQYRIGGPLFPEDMGAQVALRLGKLNMYKSPVYTLRTVRGIIYNGEYLEGRRTSPIRPQDWNE